MEGNVTEKSSEKQPRAVITAQGSRYTYLADGRTQRFKEATDELKEPQDILVYIPQISSLKNWEHYDGLPEWLKEYPDNQAMELLAADFIHNKSKNVLLVDGSYKIIRNNAEAASADKLFLFFIDKETNVTEFALPVSNKPSINSTTFDARFFKNDKGEDIYSCHIGNEVTNIEY